MTDRPFYAPNASEWERDVRATTNYAELLAVLKKHGQRTAYEQAERTGRGLRASYARFGLDADAFERRLFEGFKKWILSYFDLDASGTEPPVGTREPSPKRPRGRTASASVEEPDAETPQVLVKGVTVP